MAGIAYRETERVVRMIDWAEVGTIVLQGLVIAVVGTYYLGLMTGQAVHRANDQMAAAWVRLWVGTPSEFLIESQLGDAPSIGILADAADVSAVKPAEAIHQAAPVVTAVTVEAPAATVEPAPLPIVDCVVRLQDQPAIVRARWMVLRGMSKAAIARELGIPRTTLRRMLAAA